MLIVGTIATKLPLKLEGPSLPLKVPLKRPWAPRAWGVSQKLPLITPLTNNYLSHSSKTWRKFEITTISKKNFALCNIGKVFQCSIGSRCEALPVLRTGPWLPAALWPGNPPLYPSYTPHNHLKIPLKYPLKDVQIFTLHSSFQSLVAMVGTPIFSE